MYFFRGKAAEWLHVPPPALTMALTALHTDTN